MNYSAIMTSAADRAQGVLSKMQGATTAAPDNFLYAMETGVGVFGAAQIVEVPQPGGGYRRRAQLNLTVTRTQDFYFEPKTKLVRLASGAMPAITYIIDNVDTNDPLIWTLTLVRNGP